MRRGTDTPSEPLPAIFCWWDVSCFFKHRLQNKSHVVSSSAEGNDCGLAGNAASEYGMNVAVKHATLRCYGPGRALILLLIMPFGVVDSQRPYSEPGSENSWCDHFHKQSKITARFDFVFFSWTCRSWAVRKMSVYTVGCQLITTNIHLVLCGDF